MCETNYVSGIRCPGVTKQLCDLQYSLGPHFKVILSNTILVVGIFITY